MNTAAIPVAFGICAILLLWHIIASKGYWVVKAFTIAATLFFGISLWHSIDSYLGWPTLDNPPAKFAFLWGLVKEPSSEASDDGAIYIWLKEIKKSSDIEEQDYLALLAYESDGKEPRVHKLPYSKKSADAVKGAKAKAARGKPVIGEFKEGNVGEEKEGSGKNGQGKGDGSQGSGQGDGKGKQGRGNGKGGWDSRGLGEIRFYDLPPATYPMKSEPEPQ